MQQLKQFQTVFLHLFVSEMYVTRRIMGSETKF
jgi:hypothetical protein